MKAVLLFEFNSLEELDAYLAGRTPAPHNNFTPLQKEMDALEKKIDEIEHQAEQASEIAAELQKEIESRAEQAEGRVERTPEAIKAVVIPAAEQTANEDVPTEAQIRSLLSTKLQAGHNKACAKFLKDHGAANFTKLSPEHHVEMWDFLNNLVDA